MIPGQLDLFTDALDGPVVPADPHQIWIGGTYGNRAAHHRPACRTCRWAGVNHDTENAAVAEGMDHAWPGWRDLPLLADRPDQPGRERAQWDATLARTYPAGWTAAGGPVRTRRTWPGHRSYFDQMAGYWHIGVVPGEAGQ